MKTTQGLAVLLSSSAVYALTSEQASGVVADIRQMIPANAQARGDLFGGLVRLAFHDCAGSGGCDGCFDISLEDHGGLGPIADGIEAIWERNSDVISRSDLWALAGVVAVFEAGGPAIPFSAGRADCANEALADDTGLLPLADPPGDTWSHVQQVFTNRMGLTERDIVALMGAHTLGRAQDANSGFNGAWVGDPELFTNEFYDDILGRRWNRQRQAGGQVWTDNGRIMLDTDIAIMADPDSCNSIGGRQMDLRDCTPNPSARPIAEEYIADQDVWFSDFSDAFVKMQALGATNLTPVELNLDGTLVTPPPATPTPAPATPTQRPAAPTLRPTPAPETSPTVQAPTRRRRRRGGGGGRG